MNLGVNGIHYRPGEDGYVYFTNSFRPPVLSRIPINPTTGAQTGPEEVVVESVAEYIGGPDDFTFDSTDAAAYIADGVLDGLLKVDVDSGETEVLIGGTDRSKVVGETARHFGRTAKDIGMCTTYTTTNCGLAVPPPRGHCWWKCVCAGHRGAITRVLTGDNNCVLGLGMMHDQNAES
jgi:hypothetical protein